MNNFLIKVFSGEYDNEDAYDRLTHYLMNKAYIGCYGFMLPMEEASIIRQFQLSAETSKCNNNRLTWHFIVSTHNIKSHKQLLLLGEKIAYLFAANYQILYALDLDSGHYHLHFVANAYSYHPDKEPMTEITLTQYICQIKTILNTYYPGSEIMIDWKELEQNV